MINKRDVLRIKLPYPSIQSRLAVNAHMYICKNADHPQYSFIKYQTLKPYMLIDPVIKHYCDEMPDISRNPFQKPTRIDCDKLFSTQSVIYDDLLKTSTREDICAELFFDILKELETDGYEEISINENALIMLNPCISKIQPEIR